MFVKYAQYRLEGGGYESVVGYAQVSGLWP